VVKVIIGTERKGEGEGSTGSTLAISSLGKLIFEMGGDGMIGEADGAVEVGVVVNDAGRFEAVNGAEETDEEER
jgi:hypothetical protein